MNAKAKKVVDRLLETEFVSEPITGVRHGDRKYTFYPYAGPMYSKKGGLLGYIKTRAGKVHGRFYTRGQFFMFEPADDSLDFAEPYIKQDPITFLDISAK